MWNALDAVKVCCIRPTDRLWRVLVCVVVIAGLSGCVTAVQRIPDTVTEADFARGRVLVSLWDGDLGFANTSLSHLMLDERELSQWVDGSWRPCISEGEWSDEGWGVLLPSRGGAVTSEESWTVNFYCLGASRVRYGSLEIVSDGDYPLGTGPMRATRIAEESQLGFIVDGNRACVVQLDHDEEVTRRVFTRGRFVVHAPASSRVWLYGCSAEAPASAQAPELRSGALRRGVWTIGPQSAGRYVAGHPWCLLRVQSAGVFGPIATKTYEQSGAVEFNPGDTVSLNCRWSKEE